MKAVDVVAVVGGVRGANAQLEYVDDVAADVGTVAAAAVNENAAEEGVHNIPAADKAKSEPRPCRRRADKGRAIEGESW